MRFWYLTHSFVGNFSHIYCCLLTFFQNQLFQKKIFQDQTVWVLIWFQTVCKGYLQTIKVAADNQSLCCLPIQDGEVNKG